MNYMITNELVEGLKNIFNDCLVSIILYGSVARGTETDESDVDIAIIIKDAKSQPVTDKLVDFTLDLDLKYDKVFSVIDIDYDEFLKWENVLPFYKNVKKDVFLEIMPLGVGKSTSLELLLNLLQLNMDERTQSQAEFTVISLRNAPEAVVIGSPSVGADGESNFNDIRGFLEINSKKKIRRFIQCVSLRIFKITYSFTTVQNIHF